MGVFFAALAGSREVSMDYRSSDEIQKVVNKFFGKVKDSDRPTVDNLGKFEELCDASIAPNWDSDCGKLHAGFDLGVKYAQERIDAKLNGKPLPDLWIAFAPETNHFFVGTEESVIEHLIEAARHLELEACVCSAMTLFSHGCQCSTNSQD